MKLGKKRRPHGIWRSALPMNIARLSKAALLLTWILFVQAGGAQEGGDTRGDSLVSLSLVDGTLVEGTIIEERRPMSSSRRRPALRWGCRERPSSPFESATPTPSRVPTRTIPA